MKAKLLVIIALSLLMFACSTTTETVKRTVETTTIESVAVTPPKIEGKLNLPLVKADTTLPEPYGEYQTSQVLETKDPLTGKTSKAVVDIKVNIKKNPKTKPGQPDKPIVEANVKAQGEDFNTDTKVTSRKEDTGSNSKTEPFLITIWNDVKFWLLGLFIIMIGAIVILKKFFPTLIKTYLKI